jgi:hypothetical protein
MLKLDMTLGEKVDGSLHIRVDDTPILEATLYDNDGSAFLSGYSAYLLVRRSYDDLSGQVIIPEITETTPGNDNIFYFDLYDIAFEAGVYEAFVMVEGSWDTTPTTPISDVYSFEAFIIEVDK